MARARRRRRAQDRYGRQARREGFAARSVYKLEAIDRKVGLLKRGDRVLDLGAAPGSWTAYAAEKVKEGRVLGFDLQPHRAALPPNAEIRVGDVTALDPNELGQFDVVLSDMAPSTIGHRFTDMTRSFQLFLTALAVAERVLRPGGRFAGKIFQGGEFPEAQKAMKARFRQHRVVRPEAVRNESYEVYLVGTGFAPVDDLLPLDAERENGPPDITSS